MSYKEITEGQAVVDVDTADIVSKDLEVFYNPLMKLNRDITIDILKAYFKKPIKAALPLAGSGIRAVRLLKEIPQLIDSLDVNDLSPDATTLIKHNLQKNNVQDKATVHNTEATLFLDQAQGFDYIDIDPYGSPNQFLDIALRKIARGGLLAVTATDTAALAGTYPQTCMRKYWSKSAICPQKHEMGLRILARKVIMIAAHHAKIATPILSYHHKHYYRIFFKITKSRTKASDSFFTTNSYFSYDQKSGQHIVDDKPLKDWTWIGPMYNGPLHDNKFLEQFKEQHLFIYDHALEELDIVGYYDTHILCKKHNILLGSLQSYVEVLQSDGFNASRAATNRHAIKTNAPFEKVIDVLRNNQTKK